tara:strand:+ start:171 stop:977 length:807 start_codon:yes stop_codon:yes gene_type:complete
MKSWLIASLLTLFPITGWCGAHHAYLGNDRRFYAHIISFFLLFYIIFNTVPRENISAVLAITLIFFTMLNWYNSYGYIRFGLISVKGKTNFWNDAWKINWKNEVVKKSRIKKPKVQNRRKRNKDKEDYSEKYFKSLNLAPEEEKRRKKNMEKFAAEVMVKYAKGEYDNYLEEERRKEEMDKKEIWMDDDGKPTEASFAMLRNMQNKMNRLPKTNDELEEARRLYSEKYESQEWWDEFKAAEPDKKKKMSREKVKADSEANGNYFIRND